MNDNRWRVPGNAPRKARIIPSAELTRLAADLAAAELANQIELVAPVISRDVPPTKQDPKSVTISINRRLLILGAGVFTGLLFLGVAITSLFVSTNGNATTASHSPTGKQRETLSPAQRPADINANKSRSDSDVAASDATPSISPPAGAQVRNEPAEHHATPSIPSPGLRAEEFDYKQAMKGVVLLKGHKNQGSGFLLAHPNGIVVTNYHVIKENNYLLVEFHDGTRRVASHYVHLAREKDLAFLRIDDPPPSATGLILETKQPKVEAVVRAIGSPIGFKNTVTKGEVSGIRNGVEMNATLPPDSLRTLPAKSRWIQFTADISHGSSGGPLLDTNGSVVGVTTLGFASGLNFAVSALDVIEELENAGVLRSRELSSLPKTNPTPRAVAQESLAPAATRVERATGVERELAETNDAIRRQQEIERQALHDANVSRERDRIMLLIRDLRLESSQIESQGNQLITERNRTVAQGQLLQARAMQLRANSVAIQTRWAAIQEKLKFAVQYDAAGVTELRIQSSRLEAEYAAAQREFQQAQVSYFRLETAVGGLRKQIEYLANKKNEVDRQMAEFAEHYDSLGRN